MPLITGKMNYMKRISGFLFLLLAFSSTAMAQFAQRPRMAIYAPFYLDSAFDAGGNFRETKSFPTYLNPGLDFYLGAQAALDSLKKRHAPLEVFFYDIKAKNALSKSSQLPQVDLIIGQTNVAETRALAAIAASKKVPFISATLPNSAGVTNNPYFVVLNSSLNAHMAAIYRFLQTTYGDKKITVFTRPGAQEEMVKRILASYSRSNDQRKPNLNYVVLQNEFTAASLAPYLDSTQKNIILSGSLQEAFSKKLVQNLSSLTKDYPIAVVGMPTWEGFNFGKLSPTLEVIYSTPFFYGRSSALEAKLTDEYIEKTGSRPSDLYFQGYETVLRFALLLLDTAGKPSGEITRKGNTVFTTFDIAPVFKGNDHALDYYENKNVYFIRLMNGSRNVYAML